MLSNYVAMLQKPQVLCFAVYETQSRMSLIGGVYVPQQLPILITISLTIYIT